MLILTGLSDCPKQGVEAGFLRVSVSAEDLFASVCLCSVALFESRIEVDILDRDLCMC